MTATAPAGARTIRTVALTGQQAPGMPEGVTFGTLGFVFMDAAGHVAFKAEMSDARGRRIRKYESIWSDDSGSLSVVAYEGGPAPSLPDGYVFTGFGDYAFGSGGHAVFPAGAEGPGGRRGGVWSGRSGSLAPIFIQGDHAPGLPSGVTIGFDGDPPANSSGETAVLVDLSGVGVDDSNDEAIWAGGPGSGALVAREGDQAPGTPDGTIFRWFERPSIHSAGQTAFEASLQGADVDATNIDGIWCGGAGSLSLVAREGDQAPGTPDGTTFDRLGWDVGAILNSAGHVAFVGGLAGPGVHDANDSGIWSGAVGSLSLVARAGDHAPDTPAEVNFRYLDNPVLNSGGHTAFAASLSGEGVDTSNDDGFWSDSSGTLALVAREGDQVPGMPEGVVFDRLGDQPLLNSADQTVVYSRMKLGNQQVGSGIWVVDGAGTLRAVVRSGDQVEVAPGDLRTLEDVGLLEAFYAGSEGCHTPLSARDWLAVHASFTDGTIGVLAINFAIVPEPTAAVHVAAAIAALCVGSLRVRSFASRPR